MPGRGKVVADPVHGTINLSDAELRVVGTAAFQRLRQVKQLGLAHMVFPGADYSRFSHSLGVCHVTSRIIAALNNNDAKISPEEEVQYRLAGLLHDVGHYPFSHAMEEAIKDFYTGQLIASASDEVTPEATGAAAHDETWMNHERVGKALLQNDPEMAAAVRNAGCEPDDVYRIFAREAPPRFANLISSDLDADRIDYLLRTAHYTGLPYATVDLDYLLSQLRIDQDDNICLVGKALRTVDHFLLGRYFDYQQVAYNRTVVALELALKDVLKALLRLNALRCSPAEINQKVASGTWSSFDDASVLRNIRDLAQSGEEESDRLKATSIIRRHPPKLVATTERLAGRGEVRAFLPQKRLVIEHVKKWASDCAIPESLWYVWDKPGLELTKIGSRIPSSALVDNSGDAVDRDKAAQAIRILKSKTNASVPIMSVPQSLMSVLADYALYSLRVYVVFPPGREKDRKAVEETIARDLNDIDWM